MQTVIYISLLNIITQNKTKKTLLHVQSACDESSVSTNLLIFIFIKYQHRI